ncbi:hypothetical protein NQ176_g5643 [Zarea fungicola]|uniref:Uncharacterized protein n=1 Tax=Zarea fungicola TaxID=93591 RepID=A0ACC1N7H2_9HYPO|nr:hypothetical protein NQ176_g5643 [Lecanicillium fungicola]
MNSNFSADSPQDVTAVSHSQTSTSPRQATSSSSNPYLKGRVRTGCLVCRSRKVKCDEQRPTCKRCAKSKKQCVYRPAGWRKPPLPAFVHANVQLTTDRATGESGIPTTTPTTTSTTMVVATSPRPILSPPAFTQDGQVTHHESPLAIHNLLETISPSTVSGDQHFAAHPSQRGLAPTEDSDAPPNDAITASRVHLSDPFNYYASLQDTSTHIHMTLTMDWLLPSDTPIQSSFSYFVTDVDVPFLSAFDSLNWQRVKTYVAQMGIRDASVATGILAVQALHRSQVNQLPMAHATSLYQDAMAAFESQVENRATEFDTVLVVAFLICIAVVTLPNEDAPPVKALEGVFESSLPVFAFYYHLQRISSEAVGISHYHRSRITPEDQAEVADVVAGLQAKLHRLWEARPSTLRLPSGQLHDHFSSTIAEPLASLVGICVAAYYTETIAMNRNLGDPPFANSNAIEAMEHIRATVEATSSLLLTAENASTINPGYLRALFYYAIETPRRQDMQWAVGCLKQIRNPMSRGSFFATLAEALGEAQRSKGRRVTMKAFCYQTFGVPMPFM